MGTVTKNGGPQEPRRWASPPPVIDALDLVVVGLDHTTAGIELRERVAFADTEIAAALAQLTDPAHAPLGQAAILSTCNRVELYGAARSARAPEQLAAFLARYHRLEPRELAGRLYVHRGDDVPYHLAATAAGMRSLVLGEAQIQGQVRTALDYAIAAGTAGPELRRLFETAIAAGRQVRSRTGLGHGLSSVPHASVEFARERLGTLHRSTVVLIGAGTIAELAAKQIAKRGARELLVLGRDVARAEGLARRHGGCAVMPARLGDALARADLVISSTGAPRPILHRDEVDHAVARRGRDSSAPLLLIDLGVPRDIDPTVGGLAGVELHTIDDLRPLSERAIGQRSAHLSAASSIVHAEVDRFTRWLSRRRSLRLRHTVAVAADESYGG